MVTTRLAIDRVGMISNATKKTEAPNEALFCISKSCFYSQKYFHSSSTCSVCLKWAKNEMRLIWNAFLTIISKIVLSHAILFRGENGMKHSRIPWKHDNKKYAKVISIFTQIFMVFLFNFFIFFLCILFSHQNRGILVWFWVRCWSKQLSGIWTWQNLNFVS